MFPNWILIQVVTQKPLKDEEFSLNHQKVFQDDTKELLVGLSLLSFLLWALFRI